MPSSHEAGLAERPDFPTLIITRLAIPADGGIAMKFTFSVDRAAAIRGGHNQAGEITLDIDVSTLSQD
jgi:hypothetical protein